MTTQSPDTHPEIEKRLISLIRNLSNAEKLSMVRSLSSNAMKLSKRAIRRANPDLDEKELDLKFVSLHYGEELAVRLRKYLDTRSL